MTTITTTRRFKPLAAGSIGRAIHEIRLLSDGSAEYWVQPVAGAEQGAMHSVIRFEHVEIADLERDVQRGLLLETSATT